MAPHTRSDLFLFLLLCTCLVLPAGADTTSGTTGIFLFLPEAGSVHSTQITDFTRGPDGEVLIATAYGLSTYTEVEYAARQPRQYLCRPDGRFCDCG